MESNDDFASRKTLFLVKRKTGLKAAPYEPVSSHLDEITVRAKISKMMRNVAFIEAELMDADNIVLTRAELIYFCTPKFKLDEKAFPASGCKVEGE